MWWRDQTSLYTSLVLSKVTKFQLNSRHVRFYLHMPHASSLSSVILSCLFNKCEGASVSLLGTTEATSQSLIKFDLNKVVH